jgi:hypothetical protein
MAQDSFLRSITTNTFPYEESPAKLSLLPAADVEVLRALAVRTMAIAAHPLNIERKGLWYRHNSLQRTRPLVLAEIQGCLDELYAARRLELICINPWARSVELVMRKEIYEFEVLQDDHVVEPWLNLNWIVRTTSLVDESELNVKVPQTGGRLGARRWDPPIKDISRDFHKLRPRMYAVDREGTHLLREALERAVGAIMPVRIRGRFWWSLGMTWSAIELIGMEQLMLAMYDDPDGLHRLMSFLSEDQTAYAEWLEGEGLLSLNNENDYVGSGSMGYTAELPPTAATTGELRGRTVRRKDLWVLLESQETAAVGPQQFEGFVFPYQEKIARQYGMCYYGCCEPLDSRWDIVKRIHTLRSVSVSPWADQEFLAEALSDRFVFSRKPNPALISTGHFDEAALRDDVRHTLDAAQSCIVEIIMKDVHTLEGKPERLSRWVEIAREEIAARGWT